MYSEVVGAKVLGARMIASGGAIFGGATVVVKLMVDFGGATHGVVADGSTLGGHGG
jgi:hypothetical protein